MQRASYRALATVLNITLLAFLLMAALGVSAGQDSKPLREQEVIQLLEDGVPSARVSERVDDRGTDFDLTAEIEQKVQKAGGADDVVAALRRAAQRRAESGHAPAPAPAIPIPGIKVTAVQFYESPYEAPEEQSQRVYRSSFDRFTSRTIYWELDLSFPPPGKRIDFQLEAFWYKADKSKMAHQTVPAFVNQDWDTSQHTLGLGYVEPGHWIPGIYRVDLYFKNQQIGSGTFEIN